MSLVVLWTSLLPKQTMKAILKSVAKKDSKFRVTISSSFFELQRFNEFLQLLLHAIVLFLKEIEPETSLEIPS